MIEPIAIAEDDEIQDFTDQLITHANEELQKHAQRFRDVDANLTCETRVVVDLVPLQSSRMKTTST